MLGLGSKHDHRLIGVLKRCPVEVDEHCVALGNHEAHPAAGDVLPAELRVRQAPIDLLDRMARRQPIGCSQAMANGANSKACCMPHPINTVTQRGDTRRVDPAPEHLSHQLVELFAPDLPPRLPARHLHSRSPAVRGSMPRWQGCYTRSTTSGTEGTPQTTTSPVWMPRRTVNCTPCSGARRVLSWSRASIIPSPARTARWASSSCACG
jgi:hypothetical protein